MMRPDTKVENVYLFPKSVNFRKSVDGLATLVELGYKSGGVRLRTFRLSQQNPEPGEDLVLEAQCLLPLAQAAGILALQNIARCQRDSDHPERSGTELATRRF